VPLLRKKKDLSDEQIFYNAIYRMFQEERSVFWEVIVPVIIRKRLYMYMSPILNGFKDIAISLYSSLYTTGVSNVPCPHTSCKVR
jgi:hypothetical protein